jgi:hypothetical protein
LETHYNPIRLWSLTLVSYPIKDKTCWKVGRIISVSKTSLKNLFSYLPTYLFNYPLQDPLPRKKNLFSYLPTYKTYPCRAQLPINTSLFSYLPTYKTYPLQNQLPKENSLFSTYLENLSLARTITKGK